MKNRKSRKITVTRLNKQKKTSNYSFGIFIETFRITPKFYFSREAAEIPLKLVHSIAKRPSAENKAMILPLQEIFKVPFARMFVVSSVRLRNLSQSQKQ